jgi:hypothetical protein
VCQNHPEWIEIEINKGLRPWVVPNSISPVDRLTLQEAAAERVARFRGAYSPTDPGILIDIYYPVIRLIL